MDNLRPADCRSVSCEKERQPSLNLITRIEVDENAKSHQAEFQHCPPISSQDSTLLAWNIEQGEAGIFQVVLCCVTVDP